jgi:hypothetical protein
LVLIGVLIYTIIVIELFLAACWKVADILGTG